MFYLEIQSIKERDHRETGYSSGVADREDNGPNRINDGATSRLLNILSGTPQNGKRNEITESGIKETGGTEPQQFEDEATCAPSTEEIS